MSSNRETRRSSARLQTNSRTMNWLQRPWKWIFPAIRRCLQDLYLATRETKEQQVLDRLSHAKGLIEGGADLKATDPQGRTALALGRLRRKLPHQGECAGSV